MSQVGMGEYVAKAVAGLAAISLLSACPLYAQGVSRQYEHVHTIGSVDGPPEYTFEVLADAAFAPDGSILVLDAQAAVVRMYDRGGRHIRSIGRRGSGPGELQFPTMLVVAHDRIGMIDPSQSRYALFRTDGSHIETTRVQHDATFPIAVPVRHGHRVLSAPNTISIRGPLLRLTSQSAAVIRREGPSARASSFHAMALARAGGAGLDTLLAFDHGFTFVVEDRGVDNLRYTFGPQGAWALAGDSMLATVDGYTGAVRLLEFTATGTRVLWAGRANIEPEPLSYGDLEDLAELHWRDRQRPASYQLLGPSHRPQLGQPVIATNGDLWVPRNNIDPRRQQGATEQVYIIVPRSGGQQLTRFPPRSEVMAVDGDTVLVRVTDEWNVTYLQVWHAAAGIDPMQRRE